MVDSHGDTDSAPEPIEDGQLTIRIPNPKVYMARQSMWIGRRGKPRCDHCRMKNLKVGCHEPSLSYEPRSLTTIQLSAIGFYRLVTTARGPTEENVNIPLCQHQHIEVFHGAIGVVQRISRSASLFIITSLFQCIFNIVRSESPHL
jgi:hypothetical protein